MSWQQSAIALWQQNPLNPNYKKIALQLSQEYGVNVHFEAVRSAIKRSAEYKSTKDSIKLLVEPPAKSQGHSAENLLQAIEKPSSIDSLCQKFGTSQRVITAHLDDLRDQGYIIDVNGGQVSLVKNIVVHQDIPCRWNGDKIVRFGVVSDVHLCSKSQQIGLLNNFYDILESENIETVYNAGDVTDGYKMRPGHEHDVFCHGADDQRNYVVNNYPRRKGIKTRFILGNHDYSHVKNGGHDIGIAIANERDDMEYLGMLNAVIPLTPNCNLEVNHPLDGASYATSYSVQKYIDSYHGGEKPNFLINGHHHKALYGCYRNVHYLEAGTFEMQSGWMRGKRIAAHVGGWIVEIHVDDEAMIGRVKCEWIPYYKFKHDDY